MNYFFNWSKVSMISVLLPAACRTMAKLQNLLEEQHINWSAQPISNNSYSFSETGPGMLREFRN